MIRMRYVVVLGLALAGGFFLLGAAWVQTKAFPYEQIRQMDWLVLLKRDVVGSARPTSVTASAFSDLALEHFEVGRAASVRVERGGIHAVGNEVLLVTSRGHLKLYRNDGGNKTLTPLDIQTRNHFAEIIAYADSNGLRVDTLRTYFNFFDVLHLDDATGRQLLLTHLHWHPDDACYTWRVSRLALPPGTPFESLSATVEQWEALFDSRPCLRLEDRHYLELTGGRIIASTDETILVTVGSLDVFGGDPAGFFPQDRSADYGKVIRIGLRDGHAEHVSIGHRNAQGLTVDRSGNIWLTEHGPQGGDELNLIVTGGNYGFPNVVYGTAYGQQTWAYSERDGFHDGFDEPMFAWLPSIGISNLIQVENFLPEWEGDLLISTLRQQSLFRMRYRDGRIVFAEPIPLGVRIRDIDQLENGRIVLWTDTGVISEMYPVARNPASEPAVLAGLEEPLRQEVSLVINSCQGCHSVTPHGRIDTAPSLWGVYGRAIGESEFDHYSPVLASMSGVWDDATLDAFLTDAQQFSPGTAMVAPGISDPAVRSPIIEYLQSLR